MTTIHLSTIIPASPQRAFDISRSIDLHMISTARTGEVAIGGRTSGLINLGETVTWRARHWGKWRTMTVKIIAMEPYAHFTDEMQQGDFKRFFHQHWYKPVDGGTVMDEQLCFKSPYGWLGRLVDQLFMKKYLTRFLEERNKTIVEFAQEENWRKLPGIA